MAPDPNPDLRNGQLGAHLSGSSDSSIPSSSSATLGRSNQSCSPSSSSKARRTHRPHTYNLDRFVGQDMFDDGTLHGRVPEHDFRPGPNAYVLFYEAKAAAAIDTFIDLFDGRSP